MAAVTETTKPTSGTTGSWAWWRTDLTLITQFERDAERDGDRSIRRVTERHLRTYRALEPYVKKAGIRSVFGWLADAEGPWPTITLAAIFPGNPRDGAEPEVLSLDGPTTSPHRFNEHRLCLYFPDDPPNARWTLSDGLHGLFDMARRHVYAEALWREKKRWLIPEAPHGETKPLPERAAGGARQPRAWLKSPLDRKAP